MWPALILAANRNDRVIGRTTTLVDSIITRNGFNQSGAPSGRKWAIDFFKLCVKVDKINLSQIGSPNDMVKIKCLEVLNVYGINPIKFTIIKIIKIEVKDEENLFRFLPDVREIWVYIISFMGDFIDEVREFNDQKVDWIRRTIITFVKRNREFSGNRVLNI
jgi:hypothetical protein